MDFLPLNDCGQDAGPYENPSSGACAPDPGNDDEGLSSGATANTECNETTWPDRYSGGTQRAVHDTRSPHISTTYARRQSDNRVRDTRMQRMNRPSFASRSPASPNACHTCMQRCVPYILSTGFFRRDDAQSGSGHRKGNGAPATASSAASLISLQHRLRFCKKASACSRTEWKARSTASPIACLAEATLQPNGCPASPALSKP